MNMKAYLLNLIIILAVVIAVILFLGGDLLWFLDFQSILFVFIVTLSSVLMTNGIRDFGRFHKAAFSQTDEDRDFLSRAVNCFRTLRINLMAAGVVGAAIGLITMLGNLRDTSHMGPSLATALMTVFYAFLLQLVWVNPFLQQLRLQAAAQDHTTSSNL